MEKEAEIIKAIQASANIKMAMAGDKEFISTIEAITEKLVAAFSAGNKVWFCGNGGSAADAQHLSAELSGRFYFDRPPLPAEALHVNTSYLTAVANDYGYEHVYSRMITAMGSKGDVLIGMSTSGNSANVVAALAAARQKGLITIALLGAGGGKMAPLSDYCLHIPSTDTPRIQEGHMLAGHIICQLVEAQMFGSK